MTEIRWEHFEDAVDAGRPLRFFGSETEMIEQFVLAGQVLTERIGGGGIRGIDYEELLGMPQHEQVGSRGFGGWMENAIPVLMELQEIAEIALEAVEPWQAAAWKRSRLGGETVREIATDSDHGKTKVHNVVRLVDRCIVGELRRRGYVVRGS